jgi:hypothetical protein
MAIKAGSRAVNSGTGPKKLVSRSLKSAAKKASTVKDVASHILSGPKGPRTASHRRIKAAVEKVFEARD